MFWVSKNSSSYSECELCEWSCFVQKVTSFQLHKIDHMESDFEESMEPFIQAMIRVF